jgi:hypothetical protein
MKTTERNLVQIYREEFEGNRSVVRKLHNDELHSMYSSPNS